MAAKSDICSNITFGPDAEAGVGSSPAGAADIPEKRPEQGSAPSPVD